MSNLGRIQYRIRYDNGTQKLHVTVVKCESLPKKDLIGSSDPFVRVYLMPGTHTELKTKVVKNTASPLFNDEFSFVLSPNDVQKKTIVFQVYDHDGKFNDDDGIGEAQVPLWVPHTDITRETEKMVALDSITRDKNRKPVLKIRRPSEMRTSVASVSGRSSASSTMERHQEYRSGGASSQSMTVQESGYSAATRSLTSGVSETREHQWSSHQTTRRSSSSSSSSGSSSPARMSSSSGGLSLRELNDRLERYIERISLTPDSNITHVYRETVSEGGSFRIQDLPQYQTWETLVREYLEQEEELARVEADIERYKHENKDLKERNLSIEEQLRDLKFKIEEKQRIISELEAKLRNIEIEREKLERIRKEKEEELSKIQGHIITAPDGWAENVAQVRINDVRASVNSETSEFLNKLSSLQWEESTTKQEMVDEQKIRREIKKEYDERLKEEIKKMGELYTSQLREVRTSIKSIYDKKIKELTKLRNDWTGKEKADVEEILRRLELAKKTIIDLEKKKLDLVQEEKRLSEQLEEEELACKAELDAKKKEKDFLESEYNALYIKYRKIEDEMKSYNSEVTRYGKIIKPNEEKISIHAAPFYEAEKEKEDSSSSSSSSEDEAYQQHKKSFSQKY